MKAVKDRLLELVKNIITSGMYEKHDIEINRKVIMINLLSIIGIINLISLGIVALVRDNNTLGAFALFVAGILIINLLYLRKSGNHIFACYFGITFAAALFFYLFITGGPKGTGHLWYYTFPLFAAFVLGSKQGAVVTLVLFFAAILFYQEPLFQMVDKIYNSIFNLRSASIDERVIQSKFIWELLFAKPQNFLFGLGQMSFGDLYSSVNLDALSNFQHNYFLGAFFGSGLLGFIPHLTLLIYSIIVLVKTIKAGNLYLQDWGIGLLAGFSGMLVILFFSGEITNNSIFLIIGLAHRIWLFNKNQISFT